MLYLIQRLQNLIKQNVNTKFRFYIRDEQNSDLFAAAYNI